MESVFIDLAKIVGENCLCNNNEDLAKIKEKYDEIIVEYLNANDDSTDSYQEIHSKYDIDIK